MSAAERNEAKQMELMLKGMITEMPKQDQAKVHSAAEGLRAVIANWGDMGFIAFSLVGAEMASKA